MMTPEHIAEGVLAVELRYADLKNVTSAQELTDKVFGAVRVAIRAAIEAEREACALLMDEMWADASPGEAIRARKEH